MVECKEGETRFGNYCLPKEELDNIEVIRDSPTSTLLKMRAFGEEITILKEKSKREVGIPSGVSMVFFPKGGEEIISTNYFELKELKKDSKKFRELKDILGEIRGL